MKKFHVWIVMLMTLALLLAMQIPALADVDSWRLGPLG
jgi:hypothetical protein